MDTEKNGIINLQAFYQILKLNNIEISDEHKSVLEQQCLTYSSNGPSANQTGFDIRYKDAIQMLNVDLSRDDPFGDKWVIRASNFDNSCSP